MSQPVSKVQFKLYDAIRKRRDWATPEEFIKRGIGGSTSTRRTLRAWHQSGLLDRRRKGSYFFYKWHPKKSAAALVANLESRAKEWRKSSRLPPNPAAQALRALASLLTNAAKAMEVQR